MRCLSLPVLSGLSLLALSAVTLAGGGGKLKPAATPEELIANLEAAARAGDFGGFLSQIGSPVRQCLEHSFKVSAAEDALDLALDEKFGEDSRRRFRFRMTGEEYLKNFQKLEVRAKKPQGEDSVIFTLWGYRGLPQETKKDAKETKEGYTDIQELVWRAVKQSGSWKFLPDLFVDSIETVQRQGPDGQPVEVSVRKRTASAEEEAQGAEYMIATYPKLIAAVERITEQVKRGEFKDREEARKARRDAEEALFKEYPPPGPKKDQPGR